MARLPDAEQERIERYYKWQDRHARLFARLLLRKGLIGLGASSNCLQMLQYNNYDRPYLEGNIDFNITHSGEYVLCALVLNERIGVDIEGIRNIDFHDFSQFMSNEEWRRIHHAPDPSHEFYRWWTLKESIIKADGRGLSAPLKHIHIQSNRATLDENTWYFNELHIAKGYACHLACSSEDQEIHLRRIRFQ